MQVEHATPAHAIFLMWHGGEIDRFLEHQPHNRVDREPDGDRVRLRKLPPQHIGQLDPQRAQLFRRHLEQPFFFRQ
jgi:hypothetical protein